jgi:hypothetical protein
LTSSTLKLPLPTHETSRPPSTLSLPPQVNDTLKVGP